MRRFSSIIRLSLAVSLLAALVFSGSQASALDSTYEIRHITLKAIEIQQIEIQQPVDCRSLDGLVWCWNHAGFGIQDFAVSLRLWNTTVTTSTPRSEQLIARACIFRRWSIPSPEVGCFETAGRLVYETRTCRNATACSRTAVKWIWRPKETTQFIFRHVSTWIHGPMGWTKITDWVIVWIPS